MEQLVTMPTEILRTIPDILPGPIGKKKSTQRLLDRSGPMDEWYQDIYLHSEGFYVEYLRSDTVELRFTIDRSNTIHYNSLDKISSDILQNIVKGAPWRLWLQLQMRFALHASAIELQGKALLFLGPTGAGKSSMAAYFHSRGHQICSDDVAVLNAVKGNYQVQRTDNSLRVTTQTVIGLGIENQYLQPIFTSLDCTPAKYQFSLPIPEFNVSNLSLRAIILLEEGERVTLQETPPSSAFPILFKEVVMKETVQVEYLQFYFKSVKNLLDEIPVYTLKRPKSWESIDKSYCRILEL